MSCGAEAVSSRRRMKIQKETQSRRRDAPFNPAGGANGSTSSWVTAELHAY
jgi:hypothetical protein